MASILENADISPDLIANYLATNYQVTVGAETLILHINQYSETLSQLLSARQENCAAIITAYNPLSQLQSGAINLAVSAKLAEELKYYSSSVLEGINADPSDIWPAEKSFCVLGLNLETAKILGQKFNQNAIVWTDSSAIPQLILLH